MNTANKLPWRGIHPNRFMEEQMRAASNEYAKEINNLREHVKCLQRQLAKAKEKNAVLSVNPPLQSLEGKLNNMVKVAKRVLESNGNELAMKALRSLVQRYSETCVEGQESDEPGDRP